MGREIKFRAWHKKAKGMISSKVFDAYLRGLEIFVQKAIEIPAREKLTEFQSHDIERLRPATPGENRKNSIFDDPSIEIMQFTGLHDKNGKEIYEGDVVRVDDERNLAVISYFTQAWKEFRIMGAFVYHLYADSSNSDGVDLREIVNASKWSDKADCEVIGNIYENPELLK